MSGFTPTDRQRADLLALYDAKTSTIYGGLFDAFSAEDYAALRNAGLIRSYIPDGCMAPITKLTPKGSRFVREILPDGAFVRSERTNSAIRKTRGEQA